MLEELPVTRVLFKFFGDLAQSFEGEFEELRRDLRAARMPTLYRSYIARTLLYSVFSIVLVVTLVVALAVVYFRKGPLLSVGAPLLAIGFTFPGLAVGYIVYRARLYYPRYLANERSTRIELSMADVINFMLALSRGRVPTSRAIWQVASFSDVLGPAARELMYASRNVEYFGADVISALKTLAETTPSDEFADFVENYATLLESRGDVTTYLDEQMKEFFEEAELKQSEFLTTLGLLAEAYVAVFVAGPLFGVILLIVMGFLGGGVLTGLRIGVYLFIPLSAIAYLVLLDLAMENPLVGRGAHQPLEIDVTETAFIEEVPNAERSDEETRRGLKRLKRYETRERLRSKLAAPVEALKENPEYALYLGTMTGLLYVVGKIGMGIAFPGAPLIADVTAAGSATDAVRAIDDTIIEGLLIGLAIYVVFFERRWRHLIRIERALPDFLNTLSDSHQRGISLSRALQSLSDVDLRVMNPEIERMSRDIRLNISASEALKRFANRVRSPLITRMIVLLTTATETSQRIGPVFQTLANSAELKRRLDRKRRIEMMLYVVIIYVAFLVFVVVLAILNNVFLPQMPQTGIEGATQAVGGFRPVEYQTVFYHASIIQGLFGGLVAGKMSEARVAAGAKHALVMIAISYITFTAILPAFAVAL